MNMDKDSQGDAGGAATLPREVCGRFQITRGQPWNYAPDAFRK